MKRDVMLTITGLQYDIDETEPIEVRTAASYYIKDGRHFLLYNEISEEPGTVVGTGTEGAVSTAATSCRLKITSDRIDLIKKGSVNSHMIFETGKKIMSGYNTAFGELLVGIDTRSIDISESDSSLSVELVYGLEINEACISECRLHISVNDTRE